MRCSGLAALVLLLRVGADLGEEDGGDDGKETFYSPKERRAHAKMEEAVIFPIESKEHQQVLHEVEVDLVDIYNNGRGKITAESLILLGDLAQRSSASEADVAQHEAMMNQAGIYYEDAFEHHNSTEAYFKLGKVVESLGLMQGTAGNETGKEQLLDQANKMFLVCGAKGHNEAMRSLVANCEKNVGFGPDGCPHAVRSQARQFHEELLKESPDDPLVLGKLAIFYAQGYGVQKADLPKACALAARAAKGNAAILSAAESQGSEKNLKGKDLDAIGYNTNNYILNGNCKYFNDFDGAGDKSDRVEGRDILRAGLKLKELGDSELEKHLMSTIGPDEEPTYSGRVEWHNAHSDELGDRWFVYIWVSLSKGFFWSPRLRLGDMALTVNQKGDGLIDLSGSDPPFWLEAEMFLPPNGGNPGQLFGKARRQTGEASFLEGNFTFTLVPQVVRAEL